MPEVDIRTLVSIESDNKGLEKARRALKQIEKDQLDLVDAFKRGEKDVASYNKELADLQKQEKSIQRAIDSVTGEFTEQAKAMAEAAEQARRLAQEQAELSTPQGRFDKTSQDVALAGDAESALRTLSGGLGFVGGDVGAELEKNINILGEGFAALEAAPKLKESLAGIPNVVNSAASALGTSGTGLIGSLGAVGIAVAALSFVLGQFQAEQAKQAELVKARIGAINEVNQTLASGIGSDEIQAKIDELQASNEGYAATLDRLNTTYDENITQAGAFGNVLQVLSGAEESLAEGINQTKSSIASNNQAIADYQAALETGVAATNDAIAAERELAAERTQGILATAQQASQLEAARQQTVGASQEQLNSLIAAEENRIAQLQAELDVLLAQNDGSEAVTQAIDRLNGQLDTSRKKLSEFQNAVGQAPEAAKELTTALKSQTSATEQAAKAAKSAANGFSQAAGSINQSSRFGQRRGSSLGVGGLNVTEDLRRRTANILGIPYVPRDGGASSPTGSLSNTVNKQNDLNEALAKARQTTAERLDDLRISLQDSVKDAFEEGNFLAIADIAKQAKRDERDILLDDERRIASIRADASQQLLQSVQNTNAQRLQLEAQGQQALLNQTSTFYQQLKTLQARTLGVGSGSSIFRTATRTS